MENKITEQEKSSIIFGINDHTTVQITEWKGKHRIDIRKWFESRETGTWFRTKNGLNMNKEEWDLFYASIKAVDEFIQKHFPA